MSRPGASQTLQPTYPRLWSLVWVCLLAVLAGLWWLQSGPSFFSSLGWWDLAGGFENILSIVRPDDSWLWILCPGALVAALSAGLLLNFDRPPNWIRLPLGLLFLALQVVYLTFRVTSTLSLDTWGNAALSIAFFLSELFIHLRIALGNLSLLHLTDRSLQANSSAELIRSGSYQPSVDVYVPTYSETVSMLRRTLIGCQAMEYSRKTVYLLDDQRRPAMEQLARELGCNYLSRADNRHAKAGNLNHALGRTDGEFILCFDADFVPTKDFLQRTLGFFQDPQVAMVQTPQNFFNNDAPSCNLGLEDVLQDEQRFFFRTLQPGRDAANALVCHGSCFIVRRSALKAIGGIPTETITEDWATSIRLQAAGYKLLYVNEALSAGQSADRCGEFLQQRSRWAQGTLQALFSSANPLTTPGLTCKQRLFHFSGILYYLGSLCHMFNLAAPLFYLFFGLHILDVTLPELLFYRLPFMVAYYMLFCWMTCAHRSAIWTEFYDAFLAPTIAWTCLRTMWRPFGRGFRVTDKSIGSRFLSCNKNVARPFGILLGLHLAALAWAWALGRPEDDAHLFAIVAWFTLGNVVVLLLCLLVSMDVAQRDPHPHFDHRLPAKLLGSHHAWTGTTESLSEHEVIFKPSPSMSFPMAAALQEATLSLPTLSAEHVPVRLRAVENSDQLALEFVNLSLPMRRVLIEFLFCQPGQWDGRLKPKNEVRAVAEYYRAALRLYPLAESP